MDMAEQDKTSEKPKRLELSVTVLPHTVETRGLVLGLDGGEDRRRRKGLIDHAAAVSRVVAGARRGDPYAHWALIQLAEAQDEAGRELRALADEIDKRCASYKALFAGEAKVENQAPEPIELRFGSPYAYRTAALVMEFDDRWRDVVSLYRLGAIDKREFGGMRRKMCRPILRLYEHGWQYNNSGASFEDFEYGTAAAKNAVEKYGELPDDVAKGARRGPLGP